MADAPATLEEKINATIDTKLVDKPSEKTEEKKPAVKAEADQADGADGEKEEKEEKPDEKKPDEKPDGEGEGDDGKPDAKGEKKEEEEEVDDEITPEFKQALSKQRIDFRSLEDLSKKEKTAVLEHVTRLNRAFTKAQMEQTAFRKDKAVFETERTYQSQNPDRFIADLLVKEPDLLERVNKELERRQNPVYAQALEKDRAADKKLAEAEASQAATREEETQEWVAEMDTKTASAAKEAGVPVELVEEAVANAIHLKVRDGESPVLTDAELSEIVNEKAALWRKHVGAHKAASTREANNKYVKEKAEDAKNKPSKPKGASTEKKKVAVEKPADMNDFLNRWTEANVG